MDDFELLNNNQELNKIIDSINELNKDTLKACHGRNHTNFVINTSEYILKELGYSEHIILLGKITGLLHDIGVIHGKENHAKKSSEMCTYFLDKTNISLEEKEKIKKAILDHSKGENINTPYGASLLIADKIGITKDRVLELGKKDQEYLLLGIDKISLKISNKNIIINYTVNDKFSKEKFLTEWKKGIALTIKASHYLNCNCRLLINGEPI